MESTKSTKGHLVGVAAQIKELTLANLKSRYRGTLFGIVWVLINPLLMYAVQSLVFKKFLRLDIPNFYLFLMSGLVPWIFFSQSLRMCTAIFSESSSFLKSFKLSPFVLLTAQIADNFFNFLLVFFVLLISVIIFGLVPLWGLLLLPLCFINLLIGVYALSWILATFQVFFYDTKFIVDFILGIIFFLTPIFYPTHYVPKEYQFVIWLNPAFYLIDPFRHSIYHYDFRLFLKSFMESMAVNFGLLGLAYWNWKARFNSFYSRI